MLCFLSGVKRGRGTYAHLSDAETLQTLYKYLHTLKAKPISYIECTENPFQHLNTYLQLQTFGGETLLLLVQSRTEALKGLMFI